MIVKKPVLVRANALVFETVLRISEFGGMSNRSPVVSSYKMLFEEKTGG